MRWSSLLIVLIASVVLLFLLSVGRFMSRRRECEEMRRHVRKNYDSAV